MLQMRREPLSAAGLGGDHRDRIEGVGASRSGEGRTIVTVPLYETSRRSPFPLPGLGHARHSHHRPCCPLEPRPSWPRRARGPVSAFRFIVAEKVNHPISLLCAVLGVSRSGFHAWGAAARRASRRPVGDGPSPPRPLRRRRGRITVAVPGVRTAPDLVARDFTPTAPDRLWCADITYLRTREGWLSLASVMDCSSRRIADRALADDLRTELVDDALAMAIARRRPATGLCINSDRASQHTF
jgi:hypothetical protein